MKAEARKFNWMTFLFIAVSVFVVVKCAVNPVTGKRELMLYTVQDEMVLGQDTDKEIIEQYGLYNDPELETYINSLGQKMVPNTHRSSELTFTFRILDTEVINAFAVPGGYVYFTRGILAYLNNEAELAGVMGHELGHVSARHSMKQMTKSTMMQLGLGIGSALSENFRQYANLAGFGVQMLFLKFSRDNEREADALGVEYSTKTGYDSHAMADFFNTLERMQPDEGGVVPDWFSTHPDPVNRIQSVNTLTGEWQKKYPGKAFAKNANTYLNRVNGIAYGADPRQGYVENSTFYHPTLKFQFAVPASWTVQNLSSQVQVTDPDQKAVLLLTVSDAATPLAAEEKFVAGSSAQVNAKRDATINGLTARRIQTTIPSETDTVVSVSYFIQQPSQIIAFHGICAPEDMQTFEPVFDKTMGQFKTLSDAQFINRSPMKLVVKPAPISGTLQQVFAKLGVSSDQMNDLSILNGKLPEDNIQKGTLIKLTQK